MRRIAEMTPEARRVAEHPGNMKLAERLAARAARRWGRPGDADEYGAVALLALCEAATRYNPALGKPATFLGRRIWGALVDHVRAACPVKRCQRGAVGPVSVVSLDALLEVTWPHGSDWLGSGELPVGWEAEAADEVEALARLAPPFCREVVARRYTEAAFEAGGAAAEVMGLTATAYFCRLSRGLRQVRIESGVPVPPSYRQRQAAARRAREESASCSAG